MKRGSGDFFAEVICLVTVGVDIGSTTSHLVLSRLTLSPQRQILASRYKVVARETLYQSPIHLTPYSDQETIDVASLQEIIDGAFVSAGVHPNDVDTGVVITTGEAAKKRNAAAIAALFADSTGRFVCAAAGPELEARVSAYGSGTIRRSIMRSGPLLNVDIGGGTTKLTRVERGRVETIGVISVGARLVAFNPTDGRITRIEGPGHQLLRTLGVSLRIGDYLSADLQQRLVGLLAQALAAAIGGIPDPVLEGLWVSRPDGVNCFMDCRRVVLSGGVSEYAFGREANSFGDLGQALATAVRRHLTRQGLYIEAGDGGIRSTVLGVSQFTVQVSGQSIYLTSVSVLPLRNLHVARVVAKAGVEFPLLGKQIAALRRTVEGNCALAIEWDLPPTYRNLVALADAIVDGVLFQEEPLVVLLTADLARSLGYQIAARMPNVPLVVLDGVGVEEFDLIDVGQPIDVADVVPVTVKSLVFRG